MAALPYVDYADYFLNVIYLLETLAETVPTREFIYAQIVLNPGWYLIELSATDKHDILRRLTALTSALDPDMNCYPRGDATARCYDLDGNPIP